jgi:hypothetical protein
MPWAALWVASVRVLLHHDGLTSGRLVIDDPDQTRAPSALTLAHLDTLRDQDRGGSLGGHSLVCLLVDTPRSRSLWA